MAPCSISVIIPAWNGEKFIANCLDSLHTTSPCDAEFIVVDNGSTDNTRELVQRWPRVRLINQPMNMGFSSAINQGLQSAQGQILFLLNQDTVMQSHWFGPIKLHFEQSPEVGIVGCRLLYPDGRLQHAGGRLDPSTWLSEHVSEDQAKQIDFVTGAAFAIRRECYSAVGLFDTGFYPAYYEDVDYCLRARHLGWQIACELQSVITHFESQSQGSAVRQWIMLGDQRLRCVLKHNTTRWLFERFIPGERALIHRNQAPQWWRAMAGVYLRAAYHLESTRRLYQALYSSEDRAEALPTLHRELFGLREESLMLARADNPFYAQ